MKRARKALFAVAEMAVVVTVAVLVMAVVRHFFGDVGSLVALVACVLIVAALGAFS